MGGALKSSQGRRTKRFSDKQKNYLFTRFSIGEVTGQKADAASVAKAMMAAKDVNGERLFAKISGSKVFKSSFLKECVYMCVQ